MSKSSPSVALLVARARVIDQIELRPDRRVGDSTDEIGARL